MAKFIDPKKVYHCANGDKVIDVKLVRPMVSFTQVNRETGMHYHWQCDLYGRVINYPLLDLVES